MNNILSFIDIRFIERYITFCKCFSNYRIPQIKLKDIEERYQKIYLKDYDLSEKDINKATTIIFCVSFTTSFLASLFISSLSFFIILFYSFILSLIPAYKFNTFLLNKIKQDEDQINSLLFLIKINFSLIQKSLKKNVDSCFYFMVLMRNFEVPISEKFKFILERIHLGDSPEQELSRMTTTSKDFNNFIKELLINEFRYDISDKEFEDSTIDEKLSLYIKELESKISLIFFIGFFTPIILSFLIIFTEINPFFTIIFAILFIFSLKYFYHNFILFRFPLIGFFIHQPYLEEKLYEEFLIFLKKFAFKLKNKLSPEKAFLETYFENANILQMFTPRIENAMNRLIQHYLSFSEIIKEMKRNLASNHFEFILNLIESMVRENSYQSYFRILDLIHILNEQKKRSKKIEMIFKGETFKVLIFLFLLPVIIGVIGGLLPFFSLLTSDFEAPLIIQKKIYDMINLLNIIIIVISLSACNFVTSYYFLKIINYEKKYIFIILPIILFLFTFLGTFTLFMNFL